MVIFEHDSMGITSPGRSVDNPVSFEKGVSEKQSKECVNVCVFVCMRSGGEG